MKHKIGAAVRNERQRHALSRETAGDHSDVDQRLKRDKEQRAHDPAGTDTGPARALSC